MSTIVVTEVTTEKEVPMTSQNTPQVIGAGLAVSSAFTALSFLQGNGSPSLLRRVAHNASSSALLGATIGGAVTVMDETNEDSLVRDTTDSMLVWGGLCAAVGAVATLFGGLFFSDDD